jgi:hypothetical protein
MYDAGTFFGSVKVTSNKNVSVLVMHHMDEQSQDYTGIPSTASPSGLGISPIVYIPAFLIDYYNWFSKIYVQNAGNTSTGIYAQFFTTGGIPKDPVYVGNVLPGAHAIFDNLITGENNIGSVLVWSDPGQNLAALVVHDCPLYDMSFEWGIIIGGEVLCPNCLNYYDWYLSIGMTKYKVYGSVSITFNPPPAHPNSFLVAAIRSA